VVLGRQQQRHAGVHGQPRVGGDDQGHGAPLQPEEGRNRRWRRAEQYFISFYVMYYFYSVLFCTHIY
jgi:hypothetical protein